ncbi:hypothetical protein, partial [Pseudoalteromonas sp. S1727]|uniref:hypothetical protein n=1 Tax=Pseudoalteromonas sp. S1727 TaxID=2066514 RepID=UPI001BB27BD2
CKLSRDFAMDGEYTALTFISILSLRIRVILGAPWGSKGRTAVFAPWLPPAIWQKNSNRGFKSLTQNHI